MDSELHEPSFCVGERDFGAVHVELDEVVAGSADGDHPERRLAGERFSGVLEVVDLSRFFPASLALEAVASEDFESVFGPCWRSQVSLVVHGDAHAAQLLVASQVRSFGGELDDHVAVLVLVLVLSPWATVGGV